MHRHGYKGRKFGRERDQRRALIKSLAESLILHESIETTTPKAKELVPYMEKLVTKAKKGDLTSRRQIISGLQSVGAAHKLVDELAPKLKSRSSGHFTINRTGSRRGDNASLSRVSFLLDEKKAAKSTDGIENEAKKPAKTTVEEPKTHAPVKKVESGGAKISAKTSVKNVAKRSGVRGNR